MSSSEEDDCPDLRDLIQHLPSRSSTAMHDAFSKTSSGEVVGLMKRTQELIELATAEIKDEIRSEVANFGVALETLHLQSSPQSSPLRPQSSPLRKSDTGTRHEDIDLTGSPASEYFSCDSSSDLEAKSPRRKVLSNRTNHQRRARQIVIYSDSESDNDSDNSPYQHGTASELSSSSGEDDVAILTYSPPRQSTKKLHQVVDISLPPATPKSKTRHQRIPKSPHRESNAAFWDEVESISWIEMHTPRKVMASRSHADLNRSPEWPTMSPRKIATKKTAAEKDFLKARKSFQNERQSLAECFLQQFTETVCPDLPTRLSGPIEIIWSKTLTSTAGRATYSNSKSAKIELSEKVIDSQARLFSTMAHEMCHILVWVINNQFKNPHGKEFKAFGRRVESQLGIAVDTTHDYEIHYKYQWQCVNEHCLKVYGRHSKSLDPSKSACGLCHGRLLQILPKPRTNATPMKSTFLMPGSPNKSDGLNKYQVFLNANIERVRGDNPGLKYAELIKIVSKEYRESKVPETPCAKQLKYDADALSLQLSSIALES